ncbi:MAG: hypothetical protein ACKON9_20475, partial [Planctomycetaceae bacterium]
DERRRVLSGSGVVPGRESPSDMLFWVFGVWRIPGVGGEGYVSRGVSPTDLSCRRGWLAGENCDFGW